MKVKEHAARTPQRNVVSEIRVDSTDQRYRISDKRRLGQSLRLEEGRQREVRRNETTLLAWVDRAWILMICWVWMGGVIHLSLSLPPFHQMTLPSLHFPLSLALSDLTRPLVWCKGGSFLSPSDSTIDEIRLNSSPSSHLFPLISMLLSSQWLLYGMERRKGTNWLLRRSITNNEVSHTGRRKNGAERKYFRSGTGRG